MPKIENPVPLAGGNRAIILHGTADKERRLRRQRLVERVHHLGARVVFELIDELARHHGLGDDLDRRLQRYPGLGPEILAAFGADRFPASPLRIVGGVQ